MPDDAPSGQLDPRLLSHLAVISSQYHLSIRKRQHLFMDQCGINSAER
ncbi:Mobile element protein [Candidatus Enterovibrio escicola]|uniref:Mobile element protein n=1 Tax=Candidatus Enterovibrio escicola TaxID=1927127 RepID=A0A2A5T0Z1_9GAMM|nr:Mobile element protein [Candidatus Enterovibrio escacola]